MKLESSFTNLVSRYVGLMVFWLALLGLGMASAHAAPSSVSPADWLSRFAEMQAAAPPQCKSMALPSLNAGKPSQAHTLDHSQLAKSEPLVVYTQDLIAERAIVLSLDKQGCVHVGEAGRTLPYDSRSIDSVLANVRVPANVSEAPVVVILEDKKTIRPLLQIVSESDFRESNSMVWVGLGGYTGMVSVLLLVGIGIAWWHRSGLALAYAFYVATVNFYQLQAMGLGFAQLPFWPGENWFPEMQALGVVAVVAGISTAVGAFLQPRGYARTLFIVGMTLTCLAFLTSIWTHTGYKIGAVMLLSAAVLTLFILIDRLKSGETSVRWFAFGLATTVIGGGTQATSVALGGAALSPLVTVAFPIGTFFEAAFWMIALTARLRADRQALEAQLYRDATHDSLTGLYNRAYLTQAVSHLLKETKRDPNLESGLLFIDLDRFKFINDSLGHKLGDKVLVEVANSIRQAGIGTQVVSRFGGDEFAVLLDDKAHWSTAVGIATSLLSRFDTPLQVGRRSIAVSASIGIVAITPQYANADEILRDADVALYVAKNKGGARFETFDVSMRNEANERLRVESELPGALERGEFELHYHPIIEISQANPVGFEALLRWRHPSKGLLSPASFLPIAEDTGFIRNLGAFAIDQAFEQAWQWQESGVWRHGLFISINVSAQQLIDEDLLTQVDECLEKYPVDPSSIRFELTEQAVKADLELSRRVLPRLRDRRIMLTLDDFGTGASSLSYLHEFEFDVVKIDRSTIEGITHQDRAQQMLSSILAISHDMGFMVVAEGVEKQNQISVLKAMGCTYGQGFHFAQSMPPKETVDWLNLWRLAPKAQTASGDHPVH